MSLTGHGLANFGLSKIGTPYAYEISQSDMEVLSFMID